MKVNSLIKKVALIMAGVAAITAVGFGVKAIVDYTNEDLKTVSLSYEVGSLGSDGKYVEDEGSIYTKEAFACYGLQIKPDFDSQVEYQIYYYDILDSYISCTDVLTESFCEEAPLYGAYARIVITPTDDEDGEIGIIEKYTYANQLTVKVYKDQDLDNRFVLFDGHLLQCVSFVSDMCFEAWLNFDETNVCFVDNENYATSSCTFLKVSSGSTIKFAFSSDDIILSHFYVHMFSGIPSVSTYLGSSYSSAVDGSESITFDKKTKYIILSVHRSSGLWTDDVLSLLPSSFTVS